MANYNITENFLASNEIVTSKTLEAENITANLTGIEIDTNITQSEMHLRNGNIIINQQLIDNISNINKQTLPLIQSLIQFKKEVLSRILSCQIYTTNYPLLINHIINEAKMYLNLLTKIECGESFGKNYIHEQELFWNNIMKEHSEFIRGLLDPSEIDLILTADRYADNYENILKQYSDNQVQLRTISLDKTINFRDFKIAGVEGILNCKIKSIIIPLLADHVLREANYFIRLLRSISV